MNTTTTRLAPGRILATPGALDAMKEAQVNPLHLLKRIRDGAAGVDHHGSRSQLNDDLLPRVVCRDCRHMQEVHDVDGRGTCACGCVRLTPIDRAAREARLRSWLVDAEFLTVRGWRKAPQQRVRAGAHGGALMKGVRAAKLAALRPRQRVEQVKVTLTPMKGGGKVTGDWRS
jgi:hypothetical protein